MTNTEDFRRYAHQVADWIADYYEGVEDLPVKSGVLPGETFEKIPKDPPRAPEETDQILRDFMEIIMPGMTHWQSPKFFAYFPANASYPSILGEMITAALGAQCMKWETSPAAAELEEAMMNWLRAMTGLPPGFTGVIQDSASTSTLCAILTAREHKTSFAVNREGMKGQPAMRVYCSTEAHSSVEKAVKIAGIGRENLVKIPVDETFRMIPGKLEEIIARDSSNGMLPLCVVAALGTTGSTAVDPLNEIGNICSKHNIWLHVDAAFSGSALILPEFRWMIEGVEHADSLVFNPHKWLFTNFDCSAYFVKDSTILEKTFRLVPEYLRSQMHDHVIDYSNWGIQLGRRFRALKLWFVIRSFGLNGLQEKLRDQIRYTERLKGLVQAKAGFEILAPVLFNLICFRFHPQGLEDESVLNELNEKLLLDINRSGRAYLSHTRLDGKYVLRMVIGQTNVEWRHVEATWQLVMETSDEVYKAWGV